MYPDGDRMITEVNLDSEPREVHYVSENGRIEGLILEENSAENLSSTDLHSHDSGEDIETDNQIYRRTRTRRSRGSTSSSLEENTVIHLLDVPINRLEESSISHRLEDNKYNTDEEMTTAGNVVAAGRRSRPTSAKGWSRQRNQIVRDTPSRIEINKRGVQDLFSDILYQETDLQEEDEEEENENVPTPASLISDTSSTQDVYRPPSIISGVKYSEWQRTSGLKVLRRVLDRQKILETTDGIANKTQDEMIQVFQKFKRKPPNKLKPLGFPEV
ncbi:uncharacterized protein LOC111708626 [Eurytemora carolleeae]|uniref:uncharacterized protein LOC111708626 n=1 Tax=Eurytemora carolleeae TaxID=1294199 RepID=UPI000C791387|nr:uncharacterized protein LOC111708626 [Eurytemora carolleeae]|eukprot:XP_023337832.1 uncharacterized protein LOC111708626 [Eurytemora affinis]